MSTFLDHRQFIQSLSGEQRRLLTTKSNRAGFIALTLHVGALLATGSLILQQVTAWPIWLLPHGILLVFFFTTLHECVHNTAFATPWINRWLARACGLLLVIPAEWFKHFHWAHHRHTQHPEKDPELATAKPLLKKQYALHISGLPVWVSSIKTLLRNARDLSYDDFVPSNCRQHVQVEARWMLFVYVSLLSVSLAFSWQGLVWVWLIPALLGQPFLRLYLMAEHGRCQFVANVFLNTRTTFTHRWVRQLAWNMPFHAEHHAYPAVPFYQLPKLHKLAQEHLQVTTPGYAHFHKDYINEVLK